MIPSSEGTWSHSCAQLSRHEKCSVDQTQTDVTRTAGRVIAIYCNMPDFHRESDDRRLNRDGDLTNPKTSKKQYPTAAVGFVSAREQDHRSRKHVEHNSQKYPTGELIRRHIGSEEDGGHEISTIQSASPPRSITLSTVMTVPRGQLPFVLTLAVPPRRPFRFGQTSIA